MRPGGTGSIARLGEGYSSRWHLAETVKPRERLLVPVGKNQSEVANRVKVVGSDRQIRRWEAHMSYGDRAARICGDQQAFPMTALYVEMTEQFYDSVVDMLRDENFDDADQSLAETFEDTAKEFVQTLKAWHDLGQRSTFARPELEQFEMRARHQFFAEIGAIIESIRERGGDKDKKKKKAKEASDSIKKLIPDSIWGIDLTWLKKVLNEILGVLL